MAKGQGFAPRTFSQRCHLARGSWPTQQYKALNWQIYPKRTSCVRIQSCLVSSSTCSRIQGNMQIAADSEEFELADKLSTLKSEADAIVDRANKLTADQKAQLQELETRFQQRCAEMRQVTFELMALADEQDT